MNAALHFAPDAFTLDGKQIMGRRTAGASFLRAVVEGRGDQPVIGYLRERNMADGFVAAVRAIDPAAEAKWIPADRADILGQVGALHRADPVLAQMARLRLRSGVNRFSLTGITHTLVTSTTLDAIARLTVEPIMPWDALICTSTVAQDVVRSTFEAAVDQLSWRAGTKLTLPSPQLPVIPLGVHCQDWAPSDAARSIARARWNLAEDDVAFLFSGRLSFAGKAHPFQMYDGLRMAAERTGRPLTILLAGQFFNDKIAAQFIADAAVQCPQVRCIHVDGADADLYAASYAAADVYLSLSDNHQETFGITPVEAMAAGLPVVVTDWNGYRDTVRDGVDGFRIPTWAPEPGASERLAAAYEIDDNYDFHISRTSTLVSVDMAILVDRLEVLISDSALRRTMGMAGRERAMAHYDWPTVYRRYQALWAELAAIRLSAASTGADAPDSHAAHDDPFRRFGTYPTHHISADTLVRSVPGASRQAYEALVRRAFLSFWQAPPELVAEVIDAATPGRTIGEIASRTRQQVTRIIEVVGRLTKMNLLTLG